MQLKQRVVILVDSENVEIAVRDLSDSSSRRKQNVFPDWRRIFPMLLNGRSLVRSIYYKEKGRRLSPKFRRFWEEEMSGEIKQPEKSADPYMIVDAIVLSKKVDSIILFSGDKDFLPLIPVLKANGCKVEIASFDHSAARQLKVSADHFHRLTKLHTIRLERSRKN